MVKVKNVRIEFVEAGEIAQHAGFIIMASDRDGYEYVLSDGDGWPRVMSYVKSDMVVSDIKRADCMINPEHWGIRAPYGTRAWMLDGMEEREIEDERFGYC